MIERVKAWASAGAASRWLLALAVACVACAGLFRCLDCIGIGDWDFFTAQALVSRRAVVEHGELPTWNPYQCGGMSIPANFQSRTYTPSFLLVLAFGPIWGLRLWVVALVALGFEGARRLAETLGAGRWGSLFAAFTIACNGWVVLHTSVGHLPLLVCLLLPWVLLGMERGFRGARRGFVTAAAWTALGLLEGGLQPVYVGYCLLGQLALIECARARSAAPLLATAATALAAAGLAAILLVPALPEVLRGAPMSADERVPASVLARSLFGLDQLVDVRDGAFGVPYLWHEYGAFVGPVFVPLLLAGVYRAGASAYVLSALGVFWLLCALGSFAAWSPWSLLHQLPGFGSMRVPSRLLIFALTCFGLAGSIGLDRRPRLAAGLVVAYAASLLLVLAPVVPAGFTVASDLRARPTPFRQHADLGQQQRMMQHNVTTTTLDVLANRGNLACYDPSAPAVYARPSRPGTGEAELLTDRGPVAGRARIAAFGLGRMRVAIDGLQEPAALVVNQNFEDGWSRDDGVPVSSAQGRIGTVVLPSTRSVTLVHRPASLYLGAIVSLLSLLALRSLHGRLERTTG